MRLLSNWSLLSCKSIGLIYLSFFSTMAADQEIQKTLTSVNKSIHIDSWDVSRDKWSVRKSVLHGGKQEGVDIITINNGNLSIVVCPTRGMSLLEVKMGNMRLGWDSPVKETVHPMYMNLQSRGGLGWLEGFNEFIVRCGL